MTNYNNNDDKTITIPSFVEDKDTTDSSVDMSIFKMSDEELYDDVPKKEDKKKSPKRKANSTIILCLVIIGILVAATVVGVMYGVNQGKKYNTEHDKVTQLEASNKDLNTQVTALQNELNTLKEQIKQEETSTTTADPNAKYQSGTKLYITKAGSYQGVREKASTDADVVMKNGSEYALYWGDDVTLTDNATVDADGNYWGKIEGGYIRIEYNGEIWATVEKQ